jgi:hypothetical protein
LAAGEGGDEGAGFALGFGEPAPKSEKDGLLAGAGAGAGASFLGAAFGAPNSEKIPEGFVAFFAIGVGAGADFGAGFELPPPKKGKLGAFFTGFLAGSGEGSTGLEAALGIAGNKEKEGLFFAAGSFLAAGAGAGAGDGFGFASSPPPNRGKLGAFFTGLLTGFFLVSGAFFGIFLDSGSFFSADKIPSMGLLDLSASFLLASPFGMRLERSGCTGFGATFFSSFPTLPTGKRGLLARFVGALFG